MKVPFHFLDSSFSLFLSSSLPSMSLSFNQTLSHTHSSSFFLSLSHLREKLISSSREWKLEAMFSLAFKSSIFNGDLQKHEKEGEREKDGKVEKRSSPSVDSFLHNNPGQRTVHTNTNVIHKCRNWKILKGCIYIFTFTQFLGLFPVTLRWHESERERERGEMNEIQNDTY